MKTKKYKNWRKRQNLRMKLIYEKTHKEAIEMLENRGNKK